MSWIRKKSHRLNEKKIKNHVNNFCAGTKELYQENKTLKIEANALRRKAEILANTAP